MDDGKAGAVSLEEFKGREIWRGNLCKDEWGFRADGHFIFRPDRCVERRGTHADAWRKTTARGCEDVWSKIKAAPQHEWNGEYEAEEIARAGIPGVWLESDDGPRAYVDRRYLALARRLLAPDRVTFSSVGGQADFPVVVFWRDGEIAGAVMQLRSG
jgi:hypothetical protein